MGQLLGRNRRMSRFRTRLDPPPPSVAAVSATVRTGPLSTTFMTVAAASALSTSALAFLGPGRADPRVCSPSRLARLEARLTLAFAQPIAPFQLAMTNVYFTQPGAWLERACTVEAACAESPRTPEALQYHRSWIEAVIAALAGGGHSSLMLLGREPRFVEANDRGHGEKGFWIAVGKCFVPLTRASEHAGQLMRASAEMAGGGRGRVWRGSHARNEQGCRDRRSHFPPARLPRSTR